MGCRLCQNYFFLMIYAQTGDYSNNCEQKKKDEKDATITIWFRASYT